MQQYLLIFRMDITTPGAQPTPEQMEHYMRDWMAWLGDIETKGMLAGGNHLSPAGKVLKPGGNITEGPYTINTESVAGYIVIQAGSEDEALDVARQCPILNGEGTNVELRATAPM